MSISSRIENMYDNVEKAYDSIKMLGVDLTNVDKNLENISPLIDDFYDTLPKVEAEGTNLTLTPTAEAPMELDLKGNTQQDSTTGKNLLDTSNARTDKTWLTRNSDGTLTLNYPSGSNVNFTNLFQNNINIPTGNYKLKIFMTGTYVGGNLLVQNTNGTTIIQGSIIDGRVLTITNSDIGNIQFYVLKAGTNCTIGLELEQGTNEPTSYEPYTNGASPNPTYPQEIHNVSGDNTIEICGKNLFNVTDFEAQFVNNKILNDNGVEVSDSQSKYSKYMIFLRANTTYHLKGWWQRVYYFDENKVFKSRTSASDTKDYNYTPTENEYIEFQIRNELWSANKGQEQVEVGESATPYSDYVSQAQLISLGVDMPSGYTRLDYIESSGTQYIDTGVIPTTQTGIKIQAEATTENNTDKILVGSRVGGNRFWIDFDGGSSKVVWGYGTYASTGTYSLNTKYDIDFNYNGSKKIKINGTSYDITGTYDNTGALSLYIFRANYTSAVAGNFKVYRCQIFEGTTKVRDLIPCKRDSDSAIGMLDLKHNVFYKNQGTGTFTYGNEFVNGIELNKIGNYQDNISKYEDTIKVPSEYQQVEYIQSSGTQYIDTGFKPDNNSRMTTKIYIDRSYDYGNVGGARDGNNNQFQIIIAKGWYDIRYDSSSYLHYSVPLGLKLFDFNKNTITINGTLINTFTSTTFSSNYNAYIFAVNSAGTPDLYGSYKLYSMQWYDNNTLVRDYVPCYRKSDNEVGLYDLVGKQFYTNSGTGTFTYGREVGKWYLHKEIGKYTLNGSESTYWSMYGSSGQRKWYLAKAYFTNKEIEAPFTNNIDKSNRFQITQYISGNWANYKFGWHSSANSLVFDTDFGESLSDWTTWLSTHNTIVYYVLATPTDIEITDLTLISQLEAIKNMNSYDGTTNISQENNDEPFIISATALMDWSSLVSNG